jgi:hypothetical protein
MTAVNKKVILGGGTTGKRTIHVPSSSLNRSTPGAFGFFTLIHDFVGPDRYGCAWINVPALNVRTVNNYALLLLKLILSRMRQERTFGLMLPPYTSIRKNLAIRAPPDGYADIKHRAVEHLTADGRGQNPMSMRK